MTDNTLLSLDTLVSRYETLSDTEKKTAIGIILYETHKNNPQFLQLLKQESIAMSLYYQIEDLSNHIQYDLRQAQVNESVPQRKKALEAIISSHEERIQRYTKEYNTIVSDSLPIAKDFGYSFFSKKIITNYYV